MNTTIQSGEPNSLAPTPATPTRPSKREVAEKILSHPSVPFIWVLLAVALLLLVFALPKAQAHASPPGCTGSGLGILLFTDSPDVHIGDTLNYSVTVFNGTGNGPIVCDAEGIQAFIVTPDGVTHPITLRRTALSNGESDYYKNVVTYVVRSQDIQADATVRATARDTGVIHQNDTDSMGGGNQGVNTEVSLPCIQLGVNCVGSVGETGAISFTGSVTNCGNNTLVGVAITNFVNGVYIRVAVITNLNKGQVGTFSGSWIPANPCAPSTGVFTATGIDQFTTLPKTVSSSASTTCSSVLTPGIKVTKVCPAGPVRPGELLVFSGSVSNTGNVTLQNIVVVNDRPAANTSVFTLASLAPGESANFTGSYLAPTNCSVTDTLTVRAASVCGVAVTSTATATCPILTTPNLEVTATCPAGTVLPGGSLTYGGTVRNTGDITLVNVAVVSDRPAPNTTIFTIASLAPGVSANFSRAFTVPANVCAVSTTFSATGKDTCTQAAVTQTITTTCPVTTAPAIAVTLACPTVTATTGGLITYTGTVRNSGNVTLINVAIVDTQSLPSNVLTIPSLAPGVTTPFTASFTAPVDACSVSTTVVATGTDSCSQVSVSNSASATCTLLTTPGIVVTQTCPTDPAVPGALLTYGGTVRNSGNITITNVVVLNNLSGSTPVFKAAALAPGEIASFSGSFLAPTNCSVTSTSTATARSTCGVAVTGSVTGTCTILTAPRIAITAACPVAPVLPGGAVTYSGSVRNLGNITLVNVTVFSDQPAPNTAVFTVASLAPGATAAFTRAITAPANACSLTTTFTGSGKDTCTQNPVTDAVTVTCTVTTAPAITVTLACPAVTATTGATISFSGTVHNTGNVTLKDVTVANNQASPSTVFTVASLAPGATATFTASFTAPADACSVTSTVTATGADNCTSAQVSNTASATCTLLTTPGIAITQLCPESPAIPGSLLIFHGTVHNTGNISLQNVSVLNNLSGTTPVFTAATLAPGATAEFTGSYRAPTNCSSISTSVVTGRSTCGVAVTGTVTTTCPILTAPDIEVTLACPATPPPLGGSITYTGTVRNTGNTVLSNVLVVNSRTGNTPVFTLATLAPGVTVKFTGTYKIPPNCCTVSSTVTGSGQGCDGRSVTDTATSTCQVLTAPALTVTKVCPTVVATPGQLLTYTGVINNTGNISLTDVTLSNNQSVGGEVAFGPVTLAPGESINYTASYIVPTDFCGTDIVTVKGTACERIVTSSVTTTCTIKSSPAIVVTKNCPVSPPARGGTLTYTGTVMNTGDSTLINIFIVSSQPVANTAVIGPITLAPGASADYTASFSAPTDCCEVPTTINARGQDKCSGTTVTAHSSDVCPLLTTPGISVTRICPVGPVAVGALYYFTGSVRNTGDINLTNVIVLSSQSNPKTTLLGPIELAPGESKDFNGSYPVLSGIDPAADTVTASGSDTCRARLVTATANCAGLIVASAPKILSVTINQSVALVTWTATAGTQYHVQSRSDASDLWVTLPGTILATGNVASKEDAMGLSQKRLYRVMVLP